MKKENLIKLMQHFLNKKIINNYQNKFIKRYNLINSCKDFENFDKKIDAIEINEENYEIVFQNELKIIETTNNKIEKNCLKKNKILISSSVNVLNHLFKYLFSKSKKFKFNNIFYYNDNSKDIEIKSKLNNEQLINIIKNIISYINKIEFKTTYLKKYIEQLNKIIQNIKENSKKLIPIFNEYIGFYKQNKGSKQNLEEIIINNNIKNDFSLLKSSKLQKILNVMLNSIKEIKEEIDKNHQEKLENYILIYKIQGLKFNLLQNEIQLNKLKDSQKNLINNNNIDEQFKIIIENIEKTKKDLDNESKFIKSKNRIETIIKKIDECDVNLYKIIPLIEIILIKYNIMYNNFEEISSNLSTYFENFGNNKLLKLIELFQEASSNIPNVNIDLIHFKILLSKFKNIINELKTNENEKNNLFDIFNLLSLYKEEINKIYEKNINNENFKNTYSEFLQLVKDLNNIREKLVNVTKFENILPNPDLFKGKNSEEIYLKIIPNNLKYQNKKEIIPELEHILFKEFQLKSNNKLPKKEENKINKEIILYEEKKNNELLENLTNEINKKYSESNIKKQEIISAFPYPKIYLLNKSTLDEILNLSKISINDISKYYSKINRNKELIISTTSYNKKVITGIKVISDNNSLENEIFKFTNPVPISSYKENLNNINYLSSIFNNIENAISNSLTSQLLNSLSNFTKKSFHNWINSTYSQISICTLCLIFTNEISNLLSEQHKKTPLREFNLINQKYNQWLKEESNQINGNIIKINIILTLLSQLNIIEFLIKNEISDINSFNWLKFIRHLWDKNKKDVILECGGWANYQLKQLNPFHYRILLTPDTDKIFLFNSSCFREKSASIIKVINNRYSNNSYKEIFEEFSNLFWTNMIEINCITSNFSFMKNIFDICTITKSWIYLDNLDYFNKNSNTNINNLIYLSKFMQTIQQEVILNDIKYNDGEKMFCLMSCIEIDNNIKIKEEYLKGSSRLLNFVKPDVNYYLKQFIKLFNNNSNENNLIKNYISIINHYETKIRGKLTKFYFDYDFYNHLFIKLIFKYISDDKNEENFQNIFNEYIIKFSNLFSLNKEKYSTSMIENEICEFFDKNNILYEKEHINLFKFLNKESSNKLIPITILLNGFGKHFIVEQFKKYYLKKNKVSYNNENIVILFKKPEFEYFTITKEFNFPVPKNKKLLRYFLKNIFSKFISLKITLNDELRLTLLEYIHKSIKLNSDKIQYYISVCNFNKWINLFLDFITENKIKIENDDMFNIITQSLFISFEYKKDMINQLIENAKNIVNSPIIQEFIKQKEKFLYFDILILAYKGFNDYYEYLNNYLDYLNEICNKKNETILTFVSRDFGNNSNYSNINIENYILDDNLIHERLKEINILKIFIGYNTLDRNINEIHIQNESIKKFIKNINDDKEIKKFIFLLSKFTNYNFTDDELNYLYKIFNRNYNSKEINYQNIPDIQMLLKEIEKNFPKEEYCILTDNKLIKYLCKYDIFSNSKLIFSDNKKNSFIFEMDSKEFCIQFLYQLLSKIFNSKIILTQIKSKEQINITKEEINKLINMIYDFYKIKSEFKFSEKYPNNSQNLSIFKKVFDLISIETKSQNISFLTISLINYIKNKKYLKNKINYQSYSSLSDIFSNNPNKLKEITMIIDNTLTNYKNLISDQKEFINSKYFYIKFIENLKDNKDILNEILEEVHLSLSNHFLFSLLVTFELMINRFEISHIEMNYILNFLKEFYIFPNENIIKFKYENEFEKMKHSFYENNGKKLLDFYTITTKSINNSYLQLLKKSLDKSNNKYFYTSNIKLINRDIDKLLYYLTFLPDQSSSIFKYLINKYLRNMYNFGKYNINSFLKKNNPKNAMIPITIKALPSINVTNFLCSLSAYYEINFYIVRDCNLFNNKEVKNFNFKYLVDSDLINLIKKGMNKGYWIFICDIVNTLELMKIIWEIYENSNKKIHNNFKLFFDQKLILNECKKYVEDMTIMINIDNENVDDLEAAHDIWVNVLEEKILTDSIMNETQKDILEIVENTTPNEKAGLYEVSINNNNKSINTNNSIVSIKSIYNSITTTMGNNFNNSNLSDWNFLKNI